MRRLGRHTYPFGRPDGVVPPPRVGPRTGCAGDGVDRVDLVDGVLEGLAGLEAHGGGSRNGNFLVPALRFAVTKLPKPINRTSEDFRPSAIFAKTASTTSPAFARERSVSSATAAIKSILFTLELPVHQQSIKPQTRSAFRGVCGLLATGPVARQRKHSSILGFLALWKAVLTA
jgi:hypothetical protein